MHSLAIKKSLQELNAASWHLPKNPPNWEKLFKKRGFTEFHRIRVKGIKVREEKKKKEKKEILINPLPAVVSAVILPIPFSFSSSFLFLAFFSRRSSNIHNCCKGNSIRSWNKLLLRIWIKCFRRSKDKEALGVYRLPRMRLSLFFQEMSSGKNLRNLES